MLPSNIIVLITGRFIFGEFDMFRSVFDPNINFEVANSILYFGKGGYNKHGTLLLIKTIFWKQPPGLKDSCLADASTRIGRYAC